jgi:CheY-like chemotaxis protein
MRIAQRILVADDEPLIADTLATILSQCGYDARAVYSGEEALESAKRFAPDLLICDVIMGELNGIETAVSIRAIFPRIKVLLFSGTEASTELLFEARKQGHNFELLTKPVHPKDLLSRLRADAGNGSVARQPEAGREMQGDSAAQT